MRTSIFENPSFSYTPLTQSPKETRPRSSKAILGNVLNQAPPDYVLLELDPQKGHSAILPLQVCFFSFAFLFGFVFFSFLRQDLT